MQPRQDCRGDCSATTCGGLINKPYGIAFDNNMAYIANSGSQQMIICEEPSDLTACYAVDGFNGPMGIATERSKAGQ